MQESVTEARSAFLAKLETAGEGGKQVLKAPTREVILGVLEVAKNWVNRAGDSDAQIRELRNAANLILGVPQLIGFTTFVSRGVDQEIEGSGFFFNDMKALRSAAEDLIGALPEEALETAGASAGA